jgi:hypothetical protein
MRLVIRASRLRTLTHVDRLGLSPESRIASEAQQRPPLQGGLNLSSPFPRVVPRADILHAFGMHTYVWRGSHARPATSAAPHPPTPNAWSSPGGARKLRTQNPKPKRWWRRGFGWSDCKRGHEFHPTDLHNWPRCSRKSVAKHRVKYPKGRKVPCIHFRDFATADQLQEAGLGRSRERTGPTADSNLRPGGDGAASLP